MGRFVRRWQHRDAQQRDWSTWDLEHPYVPHPKEPGVSHESASSGWKPVMTKAEADEWAKNSAVQAPMYHGTTQAAADSIMKSGFDVGHSGDVHGNYGAFGRGVYVTDGSTLGLYVKDNSGVALATRVNVQNVMPWDEVKSLWDDPGLQEALTKYLPGEDGSPGDKLAAASSWITNYATSHGYDALDSNGGDLVVFDPKNITVVKG